jgi:hypothetical protein
MMKVLVLAATLIEEAGLGKVGEDVFVGSLPSDVQYGVMLKPPFEPAEDDEGMRGFFDSEFQVIVRDQDMDVGYNRCQAISKALRINQLERDGLSIQWLKRRSLPISYPRGDADDYETSVRMKVGFAEL